MHITVQLHGVLRRAAGTDSLELELPHHTHVGEALHQLESLSPDVAEHLPRCACAVGDKLVHAKSLLHEGDVLAILPPIAAG